LWSKLCAASQISPCLTPLDHARYQSTAMRAGQVLILSSDRLSVLAGCQPQALAAAHYAPQDKGRRQRTARMAEQTLKGKCVRACVRGCVRACVGVWVGVCASACVCVCARAMRIGRAARRERTFLDKSLDLARRYVGSHASWVGDLLHQRALWCACCCCHCLTLICHPKTSESAPHTPARPLRLVCTRR